MKNNKQKTTVEWGWSIFNDLSFLTKVRWDFFYFLHKPPEATVKYIIATIFVPLADKTAKLWWLLSNTDEAELDY